MTIEIGGKVMVDNPNTGQLDRDIEQFRKDLKKLDKKIEMIGVPHKRITPADVDSLLIKDGLIQLSSSPKIC